ncbi:hypothetical protein ASPCAL06517 [Aspergillus calidoustus]|uniref:Uncharacterized protein n=1 Tax=Aspergillus calidoustus TaxID=454130 RepID=A0A0U5G2H2_ASPCI|nr:hypothetical protein ASPCAL06517 [Aspergillus calidoustus]
MPSNKKKPTTEPSPLSSTAIAAFQTSWPIYHSQCHPLIDPLLRYITDFFPLSLNRPFSWFYADTPHRRRLLNALIYRLQTGLRESKTCAFRFDNDWDHDVFVHVLAWWFNDPAAVEVREVVEKGVHAGKVDVEVFDNGVSYKPQRVTHCFERASPQFPIPGVPMKMVDYLPGSFYEEVGGGARKEFLKANRKRGRLSRRRELELEAMDTMEFIGMLKAMEFDWEDLEELLDCDE